MGVSCCHNCDKRSIKVVDGVYTNCHSWCPDYIAESTEHERQKALKRESKIYDDYATHRGAKIFHKKTKHQREVGGYRNFHSK